MESSISILFKDFEKITERVNYLEMQPKESLMKPEILLPEEIV